MREVESVLGSGHVEPDAGIVKLKSLAQADATIVASAMAAQADVFVTGDQKLLLACKGLRNLNSLSPRQFWESVHARGRKYNYASESGPEILLTCRIPSSTGSAAARR
jgi:hypothetical protein